MRSVNSVLTLLDNRWHSLRAQCGWPWVGLGSRRDPLPIEVTSGGWKALPEQHFSACTDHINASSMADVIKLLAGRPATILETGSSAWGTNSTALWDAYAELTGGLVWSVDIRRTPSRSLVRKLSERTTLACDDSVSFLRKWSLQNRDRHADLIYLDSWDVAFRHPMPAAIHCLNEYLAIEPHLRNGTLLLIDDTPGSMEWLPPDHRQDALDFHAKTGVFPGKGMLVDLLLERHPGVRKVHHRYQALYEFKA